MSKRIAFALFLFAATVTAQTAPAPYSCTQTSATSALRSDGIAEFLADYVITCTGGSPLDIGSQNVVLTLNANVTSKLDNSGFSEATLLVDEPGVGSRYLGANVFKGLITSANTIQFSSVYVNQPGTGQTRVYRFTNIRVNAAALAVGHGVTVTATTGPSVNFPVPVSNALGIVQPSKQFDIRTCDDAQPGFVNYLPNVPQNPGLVNATSTAGPVRFNLRFLESLSNSFRKRVQTTQSPSVIGVQYNTESGFIDATVLDPGAGLATQATRLMATFSGVPAGVHLFVTTQPLGSGGASSSTLSASLIAADQNGAGPATPIPSTGTATCPITNASAPMVEIPVTGGLAQAVWEVSASDPAALEKASFGIVAAYNSPPQPGLGTVYATGRLAPLSSVVTPTSTDPVPRFSGSAVGVPAFAVGLTPLSITTTSPLPPGQAGLGYSLPFAAIGGVPSYAWSISGPGAPPGLTLSPGGTFSGTPTVPGNYTFTVQLNDQANGFVSQPFSITIAPAGSPPVITTASPLPAGQVRSLYGLQLTQTGVSQPLVWSVSVPGSLPPGLTLSSSGLLSGFPTTTGTFNFITAVSSTNPAISLSTSKPFSLAIIPQPLAKGIAILTRSIANGVVGAVYAQNLAASGGTPPYTWMAEAASLPPGISLSSGGVLSGTPTIAGAYQVIVRVSDALGSADGTVFPMYVTGPPLAITTTSLPAGTAGNAYTASVQATGGVPAYAFSILTGSLPAGLSLAPDGTIKGTPAAAGNSTFTVLVTDLVQGRDSKTFTLAVAANLPVITTSSLANGVVAALYSQTVAATGGTPPYSFKVSSGALPAGLTLSTDGIITGTPSVPGDSTVTLQVTDRQNLIGTKQFTLSVGVPLAITTASPLTPLVTGTASEITLAAVGGTLPYSWAISGGSLPTGLSLNSASGAITGTPSIAGPFSFTATVTDAKKLTVSKAFTGRAVTPLRITTGPTLPPASAGTAYSQSFGAAGGTPPYRWSAQGNLPPGLTFDSTGTIGGTPTSAFSGTISVTVTDADGQAAGSTFSLSVTVPQVSALTVGGVTGTSPPAQQPKLTLTIGSPFPVDLAGTMTLSFASDAAIPSDDPSIQFSTGGRTAAFTIPAGSTQAVFRASDVAVQTGTVSGLISITTALQAGGAPVGCNCNLTTTIRIAKSAPVITSVRAALSGSTITITIIGFSTSREITQAAFQFTTAAGSNVQSSSFTIPVAAPFTTWYQSAQSTPFGSQFLLAMPFTIQGNLNAITGVSVTLTNAQGASQPVTAPGQ